MNTPQIQGKAKGAKASGQNMLDVLGNHKNLTPEQMKALKAKGKLNNSNPEAFETLLNDSKNQLAGKNASQKQTASLLQNTSKQPTAKNLVPNKLQQAAPQASAQVSKQVDPRLAKAMGLKTQQPQLKNHNKDIMNQPVGPEFNQKMMPKQAQNHQVVPQGETKVARVLKLGQSKNIKATQNNPEVKLAKNTQQMPMTSKQVELAGRLETRIPQVATKQSPMAQAVPAQMMALNVQQTQKAAVANNPKLVDFNSFMKKQSPQAKARIQASQASYAKKNTHKSMFKAKIDESLPHVAKKPMAQTKLQDVMFKSADQSADMNMTPEQQMANQNMMNVGKVGAAVVGTEQVAKVFDMNQMPANATADEVIAKIQDYAIQTKVNNEPQLDFSFRHQELGQVDLTIQKAGGDQLNILVGANSTEAMKFFTQNQGELLQSLTQAGVSVGDFKLDSSSKSNNQNLSQNSNGNSQDTHREHQSESGQRQEEQQRRAELWDQLKDKEAA